MAWRITCARLARFDAEAIIAGTVYPCDCAACRVFLLFGRNRQAARARRR